MAKRILLPLDQSVAAESVIPLVAATARGSGATVRLVHVAPMPENRVDQAGHVIAYSDQERERLEAEGMDYLRTVELGFEGVPVECVVRFGDPAEEILHEAEAFNADLVAVTTAGRSGVGRTLFGSVAEKVFKHSEAPVLLFRSGRGWSD